MLRRSTTSMLHKGLATKAAASGARRLLPLTSVLPRVTVQPRVPSRHFIFPVTTEDGPYGHRKPDYFGIFANITIGALAYHSYQEFKKYDSEINTAFSELGFTSNEAAAIFSILSAHYASPAKAYEEYAKKFSTTSADTAKLWLFDTISKFYAVSKTPEGFHHLKYPKCFQYSAKLLDPELQKYELNQGLYSHVMQKVEDIVAKKRDELYKSQNCLQLKSAKL